MKRAVFAALVMLMLPVSAFAGKYSVGVDSWIVFWDSAFGAVVTDGVDAFIGDEIDNLGIPQVTGHNISAEKKNGNGLMMGPSFTWETDNRKWSVSVGGMFSVFIAQKMNFPGSITYDPGIPVQVPLSVNSDIKLTRFEVSAEGRYHFLKYFSAFAGYQYMYYNIDANITGSATYLVTTFYNTTKTADVTSHIHFPLLGLGVEYPVLSWLTLGLDIASGYMFADAEAAFEGSKGDIDIDPNFGMMLTLKGTWKVSERIDISVGYRFQYLAFDMTSEVDIDANNGNDPDETSKKETFHGLTIGCRYNF